MRGKWVLIAVAILVVSTILVYFTPDKNLRLKHEHQIQLKSDLNDLVLKREEFKKQMEALQKFTDATNVWDEQVKTQLAMLKAIQDKNATP